MNDKLNWRRRPPTFVVPDTAIRRLALRPLPTQSTDSVPTFYSSNKLILWSFEFR